MDINLNPMIEGFWDTLLFDTPQELEQFIEDIENDETLSAHRHDIYNASYYGMTPLEYLSDNQTKREILQKAYQH